MTKAQDAAAARARTQVRKALVAQVNKDFGEGAAILGSQLAYSELPRVPSGSLALDVALGGGWPANQFNEIVGPESSGKTALCLKTVAENMRRDPDWYCVWADAEGSYDKPWAAKLGVDNNRIILVSTNVMEEVYAIVLKFLDSRAVDGVVVDSMPALVPSGEAEAAMEDWQVGLGARITGKFFRKQGTAIKRSLIIPERPVTVWIVNQWRDKIGILFGDPRTTPGGKGKNYYYVTRVEVKRDDWIYERAAGDDDDDEDRGSRRKKKGVHVGQTINMVAIKNKSAPPQRQAVVDFYFDDSDTHGVNAGQFDRAKEVMSVATIFGVVKRGGGIYQFGEHSWKGREKFYTALRDEPELVVAIEKEVLDLLRIRHRGLTDIDPAPNRQKLVDEMSDVVGLPRTKIDEETSILVHPGGRRVVRRRPT